MTPRSAKAKGRRLQAEVAAAIAAALGLPPQDVRPAAGGENGADVKLSAEAARRFPFSVECKNCERLNLWQALHQAEANAAESSLTPLLVIRRNRSGACACLPLDRFLMLVTRAAVQPEGGR